MNQASLSRLPLTSEPLIYEATLSGAMAQKATTLGLSAFLWAVWLSLWAPLFTYLFWVFAPLWGAATVLDARDESFPVLALMTSIGFALAALLVLAGATQWAYGSARRRPLQPPSVTVVELAKAHQLSPALLTIGWEAQRIVVHHLPEGGIASLELSAAPSTDALTRERAVR